VNVKLYIPILLGGARKYKNKINHWSPRFSSQVLKKIIFKSRDFRYNLRNNTNYFQVRHFVKKMQEAQTFKNTFYFFSLGVDKLYT
jgi:hypothetical protein